MQYKDATLLYITLTLWIYNTHSLYQFAAYFRTAQLTIFTTTEFLPGLSQVKRGLQWPFNPYGFLTSSGSFRVRLRSHCQPALASAAWCPLLMEQVLGFGFLSRREPPETIGRVFQSDNVPLLMPNVSHELNIYASSNIPSRRTRGRETCSFGLQNEGICCRTFTSTTPFSDGTHERENRSITFQKTLF